MTGEMLRISELLYKELKDKPLEYQRVILESTIGICQAKLRRSVSSEVIEEKKKNV